MKHSLPEAVRAAAAEHHRRYPPKPIEAVDEPARGDVLLLSPTLKSLEQVGAVVVCDQTHDTHLVVWLCHTAPELATEWDLVATRDQSGVAYPLVVQSDLRICVLPKRVVGRLGHIPADMTDAVRAADRTDGQSIRDLGQFYPRFSGPCDRRWQHKEQELDRIQPHQAEALQTVWPEWFG